MASGLQLWDENGVLIFDTSTSLVKFLGTLSIGQNYTGTQQSGSLYVPQWAQYANKPFFARSDGGYTVDGFDAIAYIQGATLYWSYPRSDPGASVFNGQTFYNNRPNQTFIFGML